MGEAIAALAAAGGVAIVQAAGTDAWAGVRRAVAGLLGRGYPQREAAELERLDQTESALVPRGADRAHPGERARWEGIWQARLEMLLAGVPVEERHVCAGRLRGLIALVDSPEPTTETHGVSSGRDVTVRADRGSVAGGVVRIEGDLRLERPFREPSEEGRP